METQNNVAPVSDPAVAEFIQKNPATMEMWGIAPGIIKEISKAATIRASKHGMFASVPIICKDSNCAYKDVCTISAQNRVLGSRCPMEIGAILARFTQWCGHFGIDISGEVIPDEYLTDATLIRDIVNLEVQMMRCENKIALSGDFMGKTLADIDRKCNPYYETTVTPESEYLMTLQNQKIKLLNQLNATRKDKASDKAKKGTPTETAIKIFRQMQDAMKNNSIVDIDDMEFETMGNDSMMSDEMQESTTVSEMLSPEEAPDMDISGTAGDNYKPEIPDITEEDIPAEEVPMEPASGFKEVAF